MKYGALSSSTGRLAIHRHRQRYGSRHPVAGIGRPHRPPDPKAVGFGRVLVLASVENQLGGTIEFDWQPDGIVINLSFNKARLGA